MREARIAVEEKVIRRVGGLEEMPSVMPSSLSVIRRVGGLEVFSLKLDENPPVIRRVGGLEEDHSVPPQGG